MNISKAEHMRRIGAALLDEVMNEACMTADEEQRILLLASYRVITEEIDLVDISSDVAIEQKTRQLVRRWVTFMDVEFVEDSVPPTPKRWSDFFDSSL